MGVHAARSRGHASRVLLAVACLTLGIVATAADRGAAATPRQRVLIIGDSLAYEAGPYLKQDFNKHTTSSYLHLFPGTALCDWLGQIDALTRRTAPNVVVLQFIGNHRTPCIASSPNFIAQYAHDLRDAITSFRSVGVRGIVVDAGPTTPVLAQWSTLVATYRRVVTSFHSPHVLYASAADTAVEGSRGSFVTTMPCLAVEVRFGRCLPGERIQVRAKDKVHFCPVPVTAEATEVKPCPVYSSGAFRFARGLARAVWTLDPRADPN